MSWQAAALFTFVAIAQGSKSVSMADDPYHHLILQNSVVKVFTVEVPPLKSTLPIRRDHNGVIIYLGDSAVVSTVEGYGPLTIMHYDGEVARFDAGKTVTEKNDDGVKPCRNITIEVLKRFADWSYDAVKGEFNYPPAQLSPPLGLDASSTQLLDMRGVIAARIQIAPADSYPVRTHSAALLVALSELELKTDQEGHKLEKQPGEVEWFANGLPAKLTNAGMKPARMVALEF
ncbi:MAG TPA: hypothetical protein VJA94_09485 [Candidatus Angelobacter sp.]